MIFGLSSIFHRIKERLGDDQVVDSIAEMFKLTAIVSLAVTVLVAVCIKEHRDSLSMFLARNNKQGDEEEEGIELITQKGGNDSDDESEDYEHDQDFNDRKYKEHLIEREALPIHVQLSICLDNFPFMMTMLSSAMLIASYLTFASLLW